MLNALQEDNWYLPCLYKRAVRTKQQPGSTAEIHEVLILLFYLGNTLERKREAARFLSTYNFEMLESPPIKERTSQSVNTLNALHKHFKLCQFREKIFISHNINNIIYL